MMRINEYIRRFRMINYPVIGSPRFRGVVEVLIAFSTWGVLAALAIGFYPVYIERAYVAELLHAATVIKQEIALDYAASGRWPAALSVPNLMTAHDARKTVDRVNYEAGGFTFYVTRNAANYRVSFRAAVSAQNPRVPVLWLCGYAQAPSGYQTVAANHTDISPLFLPSACRGDT